MRIALAARFTITSLARTAETACARFSRLSLKTTHLPPPKTAQNSFCEFYAHESLCTQVHGNRLATRFSAWSLKPDEKSLPKTVNGRINFLSGCKALDKRSASEKRLVEASGYQGYPLSTRLKINGKNVPILSPFVYSRCRALVFLRYLRFTTELRHFYDTITTVR